MHTINVTYHKRTKVHTQNSFIKGNITNKKISFLDPPQNVCHPTEFQCADGTCINSTKVCNINKDCKDGEDETVDCGKSADLYLVIY